MESISGFTTTLGPRSIRLDDNGNLCTVHPVEGIPTQKFLTTSGVSTFTNHNVNYSAAPTDIYYKATSRYEIATVLISISDDAKFIQTGFGGGSALTNGINFWVSLDNLTTKIPLFNNIHIKENKDWYYIAAHAALTDFALISQTMTILIDVIDSYGQPLHISKDMIFGMTLNDDFSVLTALTMQTRGILY